jgi:hypothetical protein
LCIKAEFQHFILSCCISYWDLIKCLYVTNSSNKKLILTVGVSACLLIATARSFVCSSPPRPTRALGRRTTLRSLLSSATTTPPQETSLLPCRSFGISLFLLDYWPSSLVPIVWTLLFLFFLISLYTRVYIYAFFSIASTNTIVFQFQIPVFEFCLSFLSVFKKILEEWFRELVSSFWVIGDPGFLFPPFLF